jgi:hypothetical protein
MPTLDNLSGRQHNNLQASPEGAVTERDRMDVVEMWRATATNRKITPMRDAHRDPSNEESSIADYCETRLGLADRSISLD